MKPRVRNNGWMLSLVVLAVMILPIALLLINSTPPARAALSPILPAAITNQQKAAILGAHTLLLTGSQTYTNYLPLLTR